MQEGRPLCPPRPGARYPPPPPYRGRRVVPRVPNGQALPGTGAGGKRNSEGLSGESRGGLFPAPPKVTGTDAHTGQLHRTGVCGEMGTVK